MERLREAFEGFLKREPEWGHDLLDPDVAPTYAEQDIAAEVERGVAAANEQMARVEQIKKYKILDGEWEPGGDELTPTMKLKRKPIHQKYEKEIEALYA